jgi:hypothetical protein
MKAESDTTPRRLPTRRIPDSVGERIRFIVALDCHWIFLGVGSVRVLSAACSFITAPFRDHIELRVFDSGFDLLVPCPSQVDHITLSAIIYHWCFHHIAHRHRGTYCVKFLCFFGFPTRLARGRLGSSPLLPRH